MDIDTVFASATPLPVLGAKASRMLQKIDAIQDLIPDTCTRGQKFWRQLQDQKDVIRQASVSFLDAAWGRVEEILQEMPDPSHEAWMHDVWNIFRYGTRTNPTLSFVRALV